MDDKYSIQDAIDDLRDCISYIGHRIDNVGFQEDYKTLMIEKYQKLKNVPFDLKENDIEWYKYAITCVDIESKQDGLTHQSISDIDEIIKVLENISKINNRGQSY
jgi:hypothetical protein